jgi:DNA-binding transcriptional LysR family regulator
MDIELLRTFLEVKNTRHFGKAAENLYLTQAAVSARIKQLETIIGGPLFTRFRNNLQLTVTGERLINHAETILIAWERARQDVSIQKRKRHVFSLGGSSSVWDSLLQETLTQLHKTLPDIPLRTECHEPETLIRHLMERNLDLALISDPAKLTDLVSIALDPIKLLLVTTDPAEAQTASIPPDFIAIDWGQHFQGQFSQQFPETATPRMQSSQPGIALQFILKFGGSAYLPLSMIHSLLGHALRIVETAPHFERPIYACHHRDSLYMTKIESCLAILRERQHEIAHLKT